MPTTIPQSFDAALAPLDDSIDALLRAEPDNCQENGHLYEPCVGHGCTDNDCRIRTCAHCGDEEEC
ncbi:hypothetical protein OG440_38200 (plasmid) [Streptomyces sp. NBC_00637]|uniref:hypothetical protein n=1 Tax=Streptomyces sp. NBC_00637 TaxID=2903667 RepID=UPI002F91889D